MDLEDLFDIIIFSDQRLTVFIILFFLITFGIKVASIAIGHEVSLLTASILGFLLTLLVYLHHRRELSD